MPGTEGFLELAGIAGVFVGFGALIAVRSGSTGDIVEVSEIRWVLINGIWVIGAALVPVTVGSYGIAGHELWLVGSLVAVASFWIMFIVWRRNPETRESFAGVSRTGAVGSVILNWLLLGPMLAALTIVVLGLAPNHEPALYLTAVVLGLFLTALTLLDLVFMPKRPGVA
jgi:hypothetical protein